jgi:outer membrane protein TolC
VEQSPVPAGAGSVSTINSRVTVDGSFRGSVTGGTITSGPLALTLEEAIRRGVQYNLGAVTAGESARQAWAQRLSARAQLLPELTGNVRETVQQIDLAALGFRVQVPVPGFRIPTIVGPFNYFDARAYGTERLSLTDLRTWQASRETLRSAELTLKDSRDLVTLAVAGTYLQILASTARVETVTVQIETARAVHGQAVNRNRSGLNARIDVNRALVELQVQQQRLTSLSNDLEKQKITLARLIGLPLGQLFALSDAIPRSDAPTANLNDLIQRAFAARADVAAAAAQLKAAEQTRKAAVAEMYPSLDVNADYGVIGTNPSQSHGTFAVSGGVRFPIFRSGRTRADIEEAEAVVAQRRAEHDDTRRRAEQEVRVAVLDMNAAQQQVRVADSNRGLAAETLEQARDRFRAGVADTIEVVQAQESVASAEQDYITALFAFNLARVSLARATGDIGPGILRVLRGQ